MEAPQTQKAKSTRVLQIYSFSESRDINHTFQNAQLLDDFGERFDELGNLLLAHETDDVAGSPCTCGRPDSIASVQCHDCTNYKMSCLTCFLASHIHNPFHWAEVWDFEQGFFVRHDISKLGYTLQLGHRGRSCSNPCGQRLFTVVDANGVHSCRLAFCGCQEGQPNKIKQLMEARLFPATTRDPHSAFTLNVLKQFQLHNLESKKAAYDYIAAIRRLSDNSFTADIPNPYAAFLRVVRVFNFLTLQKRTGQFHAIDAVLSHRPKGNLLVWCPACPEPGFNSDPCCPKTPHHLRHLNQSQRTLDGNFQCNQFNKNTDPDDVSLCAGIGYFPLDSKYKDYLKKIPVSKEKSTCNYLKAVNKQDKRKFKNMAVTGTVNCQCSHVFILSCVDLHYGERFANTDKALAMQLEQHEPKQDFDFTLKIEVDDVDEVTTYDIACEYFINLEERFKIHFPELVPRIKKMRWGVPALHVQGHQDSCTYLFGTAYMECVGHFHGESAEQYWPESNQLGPHVRQMNNGHRQDTMINHHGDWNYKKSAQIAFTLAEEIKDAKRKYIEKRNHFIGLSLSFSDRVQKWSEMPRTTSKIGKDAISVYKHRTTKVPSQRAIFQKMLSDTSSFATTMIPKSRVAHFIDEGLKIQDLQNKLRHLTLNTDDHDLAVKRKEISLRTSKLAARIEKWRKIQKELMPRTGDKIAAQAILSLPIQNEKLFLPSDITSEVEREALSLTGFAAEEIRWREGQVFDSLRLIQNIVKTISALRGRKIKNDRQQKQNTRVGDNIEEAIKLRDQHMESYERARQALSALNAPSTYPLLTEADLYMKPILQKRRVGDSWHTDGALWRIHGLIQSQDSGEKDQSSATNEHKNKATRTKARSTQPQKKVVDERPEGWLWHLGRLSKMSDTEMDEWSNEGDRVQWFRAKAEMQRWQEQGEQKLAELLRTNRSFLKMEDTWTTLALQNAQAKPGHSAYAKQKAAMYRKRAEMAQALILGVGYGELLASDTSLVQRVQEERDAERKFLVEALNIS
ncbi:hypothetical protein DFH08DRAFT_683848 [Mycena albidolilacea]|uniref:CxC2-like cysteine cluster KDZ transposase-associated domain-containing protein n=1 Tax=Mycena albidolilacea TaxID=1033008 RepID=A0AAD7AJB7_9AGAR|nr:hypothetical protein DFH08DRAFT_683848 [Mycena albidolilacea]